MDETGIRFSTYPRTDPPPDFVREIVNEFCLAEELTSTVDLEKGLTSDAVLRHLTPGLHALGFEVETGKRRDQKIQRQCSSAKTAHQHLNTRLTHIIPNGAVVLKSKPAERGWGMPCIEILFRHL